ncbi:lysosomal alpha-mannosidase-like [Schistocerca cancellata]|uniref:lysosomal alpha-mannosidase-like n=1 Tax=Schistocerca cancellata TaxID=274614 RepID=UPI00211782C4|nr:lysosomal alpha-mannosidase-like [Schistocerca cancellata]
MKSYRNILLVVILTLPSLYQAFPLEESLKEVTCGYKACHKTIPGMINVHMIPHSHDDVGWLKTVDQYYYGSKQSVQRAGVQYIIDTVLRELQENPDRRFIYVETAFLWKWWLDHDEVKQQQLIDLINSGQLEIVGGAWSMNDEAATHYQSIIDQFTWGLRKLNDTFGACGRPHVGWQIDPFGHSREMASLFSQFGYDGLFFARADYQDLNNRFATKTTQMIWQGSVNLGTASRLFTVAFNGSYSPPSGFCFDINCNDEPIIDDINSPDYNVDSRVAEFTAYIENLASHLQTEHVLVTMGDDFNYQDAAQWFVNLDKLKKYVNAKQEEGGRLNVLYSTPACYLKALNEANITWTVKDDDFFPYASDEHSYWTGYFVSRTTSKYFERQANNFLQICKQLFVLANVEEAYENHLNNLREAMGVMQHHDAITGTAKQNVFEDYSRLIYEGIQHCGNITERALSKLSSSDLPFVSCLLRNVSQCEPSENSKTFMVTVYNPLSHEVSYYVRLPVLGTAYSVRDASGNELKVQMATIPDPVRNLPERNSNATTEIVFLANNIQPLGFHSYYITELNSTDDTRRNELESSDTSIGNDVLQAMFNESTGLLQSVMFNNEEITLRQNFRYYEGWAGNNSQPSLRASGAYIFRPYGTSVEVSPVVETKFYKGELVEEVHQEFTDWISQVIRVYKDTNHIEFEWLVGPIPVDDDIGKEIITHITTDLVNNETFYTDSNGREMLKRVVNFRPTWDLEVNEPISGNYYPITSKIVIEDASKDLRLAILNDRAQGGSSLRNGEVEIMVHRRLLNDDAKGVGEALDDEAFGKGRIARGKHYLVVGPTTGSGNLSLVAQERLLAQEKLLSPWVFVTPLNISFDEWTSYTTEFSGVFQNVPENVHILTLEPWKNNTVLLRLEHILENNEDPILSNATVVNLEELFTTFVIKSVRESTLAANQWLGEYGRLNWIDTSGVGMDSWEVPNDIPNITLKPMQIRTFIVEVTR